MSQLRVLVVGASVAGPTAAYWLAKAGANVTVVERFPQLRTSGQAIDIRTAGVTVMRKMPGMEAAVRAKPSQIEGISFVSDSGRPFGTIKPTGNPDQQSLVSEYEIYRGDLSQILVDLCKDNQNIKYVFNEQIASMQQQDEKDDGPLTVEFANGYPTGEYDLVVACDGATSRTRAMGLNCGVREHIQPLNSWACFFSIPRDLIAGSKIGHAHNAPGGRFMAVGLDPATGSNRVTLMCMNPRGGDRDLTLPFREAMKQGEEPLKRYIAKHFAGAGWVTDEAMRHLLTDATEFYANEIVQVKAPALHRGRFVLVGDAGYAPGPVGTGTTLALAGAYVLAGEIAKHRWDLAAGLRGYEETMRPLVDAMQTVPWGVLSVLAPQTSWGIWLRNLVFMIIARSHILEFVQRFFAGGFANSDDFPLPEYEWVA